MKAKRSAELTALVPLAEVTVRWTVCGYALVGAVTVIDVSELTVGATATVAKSTSVAPVKPEPVRVIEALARQLVLGETAVTAGVPLLPDHS